jgi:hypothetical protein
VGVAGTDYDLAKITVDMGALWNAAFMLLWEIGIIEGLLANIIYTLNGLRPAWTGQSSTDAQNASAQWTNVMAEVFGASSDPNEPADGCLAILVNGVYAALQNYALNEETIGLMWTNLWDQITGAVNGGSYTDSSGNLQPILPPQPATVPNNTSANNVVDGDFTNTPNSSQGYQQIQPYHDTAVNETF